MNKKCLSARRVFHAATALALMAALWVVAPAARAASFSVSNLNDSGTGSLRQALLDANASASTDDITFSLSGTISITSDLPNLAESVSINGSGQTVTLRASNTSQVLFINNGVVVSLNALTITNTTSNYGIGISNEGTLTVTNSTFTGNTGGSIMNEGIAKVTNSTFSGNAAGLNESGGIGNTGTLTVENTTFSNNTGTAVYNDGGTLHLKNSILANSSGVAGDCYSNTALATDVHNLIEQHLGCGTPVSTGDPMLGSLANNGGFTQTMALSTGSPAFNAGDNATCTATDQRGITRPQATTCDIGAYEVQASPILYATPGGMTSGTCESWANACELQYALSIAVSGQQIWAAAGTYTPGTTRADNFGLINGVAIYGGFDGAETSLSRARPRRQPHYPERRDRRGGHLRQCLPRRPRRWHR